MAQLASSGAFAMPEPQAISADKYIGLGHALCLAECPHGKTVGQHELHAHALLEFIEVCRLTTSLDAAKSIAEVKLENDVVQGRMNQVSVAIAAGMMRTTRAAVMSESAKVLTLALRQSDVSILLRELPSQRPLNVDQQNMRSETIVCLEAGALRAAAVLGWALAYDCVRRWVFDNRLADFNGSWRGGAIVEYEDFYKRGPIEYQFLELCKPTILGGKLVDELQHYLRQRNHYAHANDRTPTAAQVNGLIDDLIAIISRPPFN